MAEVKEKEFVVEVDTWGTPRVAQAIRVTKAIVFYMDASWSKPRERRMRLQDVIFSGPEPVARKLAAQLVSSKAQLHEDESAAEIRRQKRDEGFIAAAKLSLPSHDKNGTEG